MLAVAIKPKSSLTQGSLPNRSKLPSIFKVRDKLKIFPFKKRGIFLAFPSFYQWKKLPKILKKNEKITLLILFFLFLFSGIFLLISFYLENTQPTPKLGGEYIEGVIGQPRFINPIYASTNDTDRDLVELIFSGLMKYNREGQIVPDLAESFEIKDNGKIYEFDLRNDIFWHDGKKFSLDDVIFTIETIQNPDYKSPLRANWLGVTIEKVNLQKISFKLKNPYVGFLESCTVKILPKHIWQEIPPENFPLTIFNLQSIGTGPFKFKNFKQDKSGYIKSFVLAANRRYFGEGPYISEIIFKYFKNEGEVISALKKGEIKGSSFLSAKEASEIKKGFLNKYQLSLPRYFAVFFNPQKAEIFQDKNIRQALNYGTNNKSIIENVLFGYGKIVQSPILPEIFGFASPVTRYEFNLEEAKELLEKAGFYDKDGDGFREKTIKKTVFQFKSDLRLGSRGEEVKELQKCLAQDSQVYPGGKITGYFGQETKEAVIKFQEKYAKEILEPWGFKEGTGIVSRTTRKKLNELCGKAPEEILPLQFSLITIEQPEMVEVANLLKNNWEILGARVEIKFYQRAELEKEIIKPRNYQALLFGQVLGVIPDLFPFWHSTQRKDPGLNLAIYENKKADKLLEEARQTLSEVERKEKYEGFQEILIDDAPVVFLYTPDYLYLVSKEIKGINTKIIVDPSKRFSEIEKWYIETKRVWR